MKTQITIPKAKQHCGIKYVAVYGSADIDREHPLYRDVFIVARYLAYHNKVVINGGGPGVMAAATEGAQSAGGETLTITFNPTDAPNFEGPYGANRADKEIKTANYVERMFSLMEHADAFVIFQGGTGTLSEWATAWLLAHLYYGNHKPIVLYGAFWYDVMRVIEDHFFIGETERKVYRIARNEAELITALNEFEVELRDRCLLPLPEGPEEVIVRKPFEPSQKVENSYV